MKKSDKVIYKGDSNDHYTNGFEYEILNIGSYNNNSYVSISNNLSNIGECSTFTLKGSSRVYPYIYDFFWTKEELRDERLNELLCQ